MIRIVHTEQVYSMLTPYTPVVNKTSLVEAVPCTEAHFTIRSEPDRNNDTKVTLDTFEKWKGQNPICVSSS